MSCFCVEEPFVKEEIQPGQIAYCLICKDQVQEDLMYCRHCQHTIGHAECLEVWLKRRNTCPSCNYVA